MHIFYLMGQHSKSGDTVVPRTLTLQSKIPWFPTPILEKYFTYIDIEKILSM